MDQDPNTPVFLDYIKWRIEDLSEYRKQREYGDYSNQLKEEVVLKELKSLVGQFQLDLDIWGYQMDKSLEGHRFEEVDMIESITSHPADRIPTEGLPYQIKGPYASPEAIPASEYVDREMIHQMTVREDLLDTYSLHMLNKESVGPDKAPK